MRPYWKYRIKDVICWESKSTRFGRSMGGNVGNGPFLALSQLAHCKRDTVWSARFCKPSALIFLWNSVGAARASNLKQRRRLRTTLRSHMCPQSFQLWSVLTSRINQSCLQLQSVHSIKGQTNHKANIPKDYNFFLDVYLSIKHVWCVALPGVSCFCYCFPLSP